MGSIEACLDKVFAFGLSDEGLEFGGCEGIDEASFRNDEEEDLGSREGR